MNHRKMVISHKGSRSRKPFDVSKTYKVRRPHGVKVGMDHDQNLYPLVERLHNELWFKSPLLMDILLVYGKSIDNLCQNNDMNGI